MTARWTIVLGILLSAVGGSAHAEFWTGNDLKLKLESWEREDDKLDGPMAAGYVVGVYDAIEYSFVCTPDGITVEQVVSVVLKFMRENPEILNLSADRVIERSLAAVWPCKRTSPSPQPRAPGRAKKQPANPKPASDSPF